MNRKSKWEKFRDDSEEYQRKRIERLRHTDDLAPPWDFSPTVIKGSIGWRMGNAEDYLADWYLWLGGLTLQQRKAYQERHPEPDSWQGTYDSYFHSIGNQTIENNQYWDTEFEKQKRIIENKIEVGKRYESKN